MKGRIILASFLLVLMVTSLLGSEQPGIEITPHKLITRLGWNVYATILTIENNTTKDLYCSPLKDGYLLTDTRQQLSCLDAYTILDRKNNVVPFRGPIRSGAKVELFLRFEKVPSEVKKLQLLIKNTYTDPLELYVLRIDYLREDEQTFQQVTLAGKLLKQ